MSSEAVVVGIDLGTSAVKVLAVTISGRTVASGSEFYPILTPVPLAVEQNANDVYRTTMRVLARVVADVRLRGSDVAAIGFSSAMHGVLCVDGNGEPLSNIMTWMDRRSGAIAECWRTSDIGPALYAETGAPIHPMLPVTKISWLAENERELFARTKRFVGIKELFCYRWTGEWLVDWGIAAATGLFAFASSSWSDRALRLAHIDDSRLSKPVKPSTTLTTIRPAIAKELGLDARTAVVLASSDGALANIGSGARDGELVVTLGTSGAARALGGKPALDPAGRTFCYVADDRRFVIGGPTSSAGASLDWIFALLLNELPKERRFATADGLAAEIAAGAEGCTVLPFLSGERAPYWDSRLRGTFAGLELGNDRRSLLRAAFEGVVFGVYAVYDVMREHLGESTSRVLLSGGLTKSALVRSMLAGTFALPVVRPKQEEASAYGAALLAAQSHGLIEDASAVARLSGYDEAELPRDADVAAYRDGYARYRKLVDAQLAELG